MKSGNSKIAGGQQPTPLKIIFFGASVFTVRYEFDWCSSGQGVELKSVNSWVQQRNLGNWELGELSWSEIKNQNSTRGGQDPSRDSADVLFNGCGKR